MIIFFLNAMLIGILLFFSIIISPLIFKTLDNKNSSKIIRKIFPTLFLTGILISLLSFLISLFYDKEFTIYLSILNIIIFMINLFYFVPKINKISDIKFKTEKIKKRNFIIFHSLSVFLYLFSFLIFLLIIFSFNNNNLAPF